MRPTTAPRRRAARSLDAARLRTALVVAGALALPVGAAAWAIDRTVSSTDTSRARDALVTTLHAAQLDLAERAARAQGQATQLAAQAAVQEALLRDDRGALRRLASPTVSFVVRGVRVGRAPSPLGGRAVVHSRGGAALGAVAVSVRLDAALVRSLQQRAEVPPASELFLLEGGRVVATSLPSRSTVYLTTGDTTEIVLDGRRYLARAAALRGTPLAVAAAAPLPGAPSRTLWVVLAALATVGTLAAAAYAFAPVALRRPGGRRLDGSDLVALVGQALASTHDRARLLEVIADAAVEATGAVGGAVLENGREVLVSGETAAGLHVDLPLGESGGRSTLLRLHAGQRPFEPAAVEVARVIALQGQVALENVSLHHMAEERARTDDLTGLANRRQFLYRLDLELQRGERFGESVAVVLADLDHFKDVNDRFGHATGDEVLREFARVLRDHSREIDLAARLGGEEFAVILPGTDVDGAAALADRLRRATERLEPVTGTGVVRVTASFGIASYPAAPTSAALLAAADAALYRAKASGRNTVSAG